jgi:general secretion pathway protein F
MESATLDDFMSLNEQLAAAVEAGLPLDVDLGRGKEETATTLEKINALVARRVSQGSSLAEAITLDDAAISPGYRSLIQLGLSSGKFSQGLALSNRLGRTVDRARYTGWLALFYPVIVCCVALVGLVGFCLFFLPVMEETHRGLAVPSGGGLRVLQILRETLPYWAVALPVGLIITAGWARSRSKNRMSRAGTGPLSWISGVSRTVSLERAANFAEATAALLQNGVPLADAMRIAADVWNAAPLADATRTLAARLAQGQLAQGQANIDDSQLAASFPPFLRWSLLHSEATIGRVRALQTAADLYRREAEHRQERLRVVAPLVLAVVIGGGATLLYGLALFVPVVEMLRALAS